MFLLIVNSCKDLDKGAHSIAVRARHAKANFQHRLMDP